MARGIYPHELHDADFQWLLNNFYESCTDYVMICEPTLPVTLIKMGSENPNPLTTEDIQAYFAESEDIMSQVGYLKRKGTE